MIDRREFIVALGATGLLAACQSGPPKPSVITVNVAGGAGMNPGPGGGDRPVTILVMRLRGTGKFNSADYFALQGDAGSALAGISSDPTRSPSAGKIRVQNHHRRAGRDGAGLRCVDPRAWRQELADKQVSVARIKNSRSMSRLVAAVFPPSGKGKGCRE